MSLNWEVDYIRDERRRRLSNSQPLQKHLVRIIQAVAGILFVIALAIALR